MERLTKERKERFLDTVNKIRPLTKSQIEWCCKDTARHIWFTDKDAFHGHCERCDNDVTFEFKTKHHTKVKCPECKREMEIRHDWRVKYTGHVDFRAIMKTLDKDVFMLRYVRISHIGRNINVTEVAREVDDFQTQKRLELECVDGTWVVGNKQKWFTERYLYNYRKECCLQADAYIPGFKAELKKLDAFRFVNDPTSYFTNRWYVTAEIRELAKRSNIYEKLEKVGLFELAKEDFTTCLNAWRPENLFDNEQTSLIKMLRLNKTNYRRLFERISLRALMLLQNYPQIKDEMIDFIINNGVSDYEYKMITDLKLGHELKMFNYIKANKLNVREYEHYVSLLKKLGYKMDKAYLFPKDFRKEDTRISDEYQAKKDKEAIEKATKQSKLIKKISDGLRKMPDLAEFLNGSNGLLVYIPESAKDLVEQGRALHNCIGTYVDRIAEGKTLVFFVRRLEAPNTPFVAFEYVNGEVVQCRADHNQNVEDAKIINFVDAFAERLRRNNVLYKTA